MSDLKGTFEKQALKAIQHFLLSNPEKNIITILNLVKAVDNKGYYAGAYDRIGSALNDADGPWPEFISRLCRGINKKQLNLVFENLVLNATIRGRRQRNAIIAEHNCNVPWTILMSLCTACNLNCLGCWAAEYGPNLSMPLETLNNIVQQGKALGVYTYLLSGGEPTLRKRDILSLCAEHPDCVFAAFTNGTLIDNQFAAEIRQVSNFIPLISVEGFEEATDARRGQGTYQKALEAMSILKDHQLLFGFSACYHRRNTEAVGSEAFVDTMVDAGCRLGWFFGYMPIGANADTTLMATAEQRRFMYEKVREYRRTKPIFTIDFWNDSEHIGGCIAGGRNYLHINANGDVEPCAFIHYSDSNIKDKSLLEALKSPLFMEYRKGQPFNHNHLRPCPLLDNKDRLAEMVSASGAHSTDLANPENSCDLCAKFHKSADQWEPVAEAIWTDRHGLEKAV